MTGDNVNVCAVIVTHNRCSELEKCLESLLEQTRPPASIVVVDNASADATPELLQGICDRQQRIQWLRLEQNLGGSGGFHHGLKAAMAAGCDWMWLMDDDCLPSKQCLARLLAGADDDRQLYSPIVLSLEDGRTVLWGIRAQVNSGKQEVVSIPFNGLLIHRRSVEEIGLPDQDFFIYGDDTEYNLRAKAIGKRTIMVTDSVMYHPHKNMLDGLNIRKMFLNRLWTYYKLRNAVIVYKRYGHFARNQVILLGGALVFYVLTLRLDFVHLWLSGLKDGVQDRLYVRDLNR